MGGDLGGSVERSELEGQGASDTTGPIRVYDRFGDAAMLDRRGRPVLDPETGAAWKRPEDMSDSAKGTYRESVRLGSPQAEAADETKEVHRTTMMTVTMTTAMAAVVAETRATGP